MNSPSSTGLAPGAQASAPNTAPTGILADALPEWFVYGALGLLAFCFVALIGVRLYLIWRDRRDAKRIGQ